MARSHRRLATIAASGALAGLATLAAAGSASAATTPTPAPAVHGKVCVVSAADAPIAVQSGVCAVVVVHEGLLTRILNDLL